jgi:hypothetical protein
MLQSCQINMDHGNKKWEFFILAGKHAVEKHLSKSTSTTKGHLNQLRQNARTTKIIDTQIIVPDPDLDHGVKTQFVYAATIDACQIYTDQTGKFPVVLSKGVLSKGNK